MGNEVSNFIRPWGLLDAVAAVLPFAALLACMALLPLGGAAAAWWHRDRNKMFLCGLAALLGCVVAVAGSGNWAGVLTSGRDYVGLMALLGALYVVAGGIEISGGSTGAPAANTLFLALGGLLANLLGTAGASMILIRPFLRANRHRRHRAHSVIFFIFLVSNVGGCLSPLGDPPLYLGFLRGLPFFWPLRLFPAWTAVYLPLLAAYYVVERRYYDAEGREARPAGRQAARASSRFTLKGRRNLAFLAGALGCIALPGSVPRDLCLLAIGAASYFSTPRRVHDGNGFTLGPLGEVAILFFGIFGSLIPVLDLLRVKAPLLGFHHPWQYFWGGGLLSAFLDNAPAYLASASLAAGQAGLPAGDLVGLASSQGRTLAAIACGSVFFGAATYIGNAPNLMVKAVAEHAGVRMPHFGGFMARAAAFLVPVFLLVTLLFF